MEFFDKLGKKASEAYKVTADKTGKLAKEAKIRMKINEMKGQIKDIYEEIGKKVYEKHVREENIDISKDLEDECTRIDVLTGEIEDRLNECLELRDKKKCQKCFKEIDKNMKFCPECGAKQDDEPAKEVEVLEKLENADICENKKEETEEVKEDLKEKIEEKEESTQSSNNDENGDEKSTLEKTVEVESHVEADEED